MIPILFNKDEKTFTSLGLGQMDATLVEVERERNGNYTLYAEVPFNSPQAKHLTKEMLIKADAGARTKWQTFKINRTIKDTNADVIKVYADHISMDTINDAMNPKVVIRQQTAEGALRQWVNNLVSGKTYDVQSDITYIGSTEWTIDEVENARQALGGVSGSILDVFGGEYEFDNNTIILHKEMGRTAPTVLEYGRNIVSLEYEELIDGVYTSIYPYATYTPKSEDNKQLPDVMVTLDELIVDSEYAGNYETRRIQIVDFSNEFDSNAENPEIPTQAKLRTLAKAYVKNNGYGIPKISQEIDFVDLSKTLDYQDIQVMEEIELNDRVPVYYPNIDAETNDVKVTTTNWDVLNNRYSKITLSTIGAMNSNSITSKLNTAIKDLKAEQKKINNTVPYLINGQGNRVWHTTPDDNMEHKIDDTWFKKNGKYTIIYKWNGSMWEEVLNDETFITEIEAGVNTAIEEVEKAVQSAQDADVKAQDALEKAGANANVLTTHQNTLDTIKNTTIPNVNKVASDAMAEAQSALSSASSAMDEAKKADGKIADYVTKNGLVNGTTVDTKINDATGEISKKITTVESKIPTEIGGRNLIKDSGKEVFVSNFSTGHNDSSLTIPLVDGETYTLSFDAKSSEALSFTKGLFINSGTNDVEIKPKMTIDKNYSRYTSTFVFKDTPYNNNSFHLHLYPSQSGKLYIKNIKLEKGNIPTDWTPAPEDNYTQEEFSIFESTYNEDVKGINSTLTELSNNKVDGTTYTNFYNNEYKQTAQGVTDAYTKLNKIIDANGNSTDTFAKAVYDRNATRQSASFNEVTKNLVTTTTYTSGIKGVKDSITSIQGDIKHLSKDINYFSVAKWESITDKPTTTSVPYITIDGLKSNTKYTVSTNIPARDDAYYDVFADTDFDNTPASSNANGISNVKSKQVMSNDKGQIDVAMRSYDLSSGEWWIKVEEGEVATPWNPNINDLLGKADFSIFKSDYERNDQAIQNRLTAIDSGKQGSIAYNANTALSTAQGNTSSITTLNTKVDNYPKSLQNLIQSATSEMVEETIGQWGNVRDWTVPLSSITSSQVTYSAYLQTNANNDPLNLRLELFNTKTGAYKTLAITSFSKPQGNGRKSLTVALGNTSGYDAIRGRISPNNSADDYGYKGSYGQETLHMGNKDLGWHEPLALGKDTFTLFKNDYEETSKGILSRLTAIDSSAEGSVVTRLNKTESTASGNSQLIATINSNYVKQGNIDASILADKKIKDTRSTNQLPSWYFANYPSQEVREFKQVSTMGIGSGTYGILTTNVPWTSTSGGTVKQTFETNEGIHTRQGNAGATAWGAWVKQIDTADTTYQKITQTSSLYERVIGSTEANVKSNMARIVMSDSAFQAEVVDRQNLLTAMASGTGMTADPYFDKGNNDISIYDNGNTNTITMLRESPTTSGQPYGKWRLRLTHGASSATEPNRGGIAKSTMSWVNGTVVVKFVAYLPTGRSFSYNQNGLGTGYTHGWLTDNKGTGKWETYAYYYRFGSGGTFSSFGHLSVTGSSTAFTWYLSEYDIINVNETTASKITQLADNINLKVSKNDISNQININTQGIVIQGHKISLSGQTSVDGAFWAKEVNAVKVNASNITTGTLDASKATITNIDASNITANVTAFMRTNWQQANGQHVRIDGTGMYTTGTGDWRRTYFTPTGMDLFNGQSNKAGAIGYFKANRDYTNGNYGDENIMWGDRLRHTIGVGVNYNHVLSLSYVSSSASIDNGYNDALTISPQNSGTVSIHTSLDMLSRPIENAYRLNFRHGGYIFGQQNSSMYYNASLRHDLAISGSTKLAVDGTIRAYTGIDMNGNDIARVGKLSYNSDQRLKTNIKDTNIRALDAIRNWQLVSYDWLESGEHVEVGLIAQNTPELMTYDVESDIYGIDAGKQTMINTLAIQQLDSKTNDEVAQLKAQVASLQEELATLKGD